MDKAINLVKYSGTTYKRPTRQQGSRPLLECNFATTLEKFLQELMKDGSAETFVLVATMGNCDTIKKQHFLNFLASFPSMPAVLLLSIEN